MHLQKTDRFFTIDVIVEKLRSKTINSHSTANYIKAGNSVVIVYTKQAEKWKNLIFIRGVQQLLSLQSIHFIYYWHIINDKIYFYLILYFTSVSLCHMFYELSEPQHPIDWGTLKI